MTFNTDIEKTEAEIKVLQAKLELLKEIETHKSQPRMNLQYTVKGEVVSYNDEVYYRLDFAGMNHNWYKKKTDNGVILVKITDGETHRLLEGVWFNDVKKGKYDDVVDEHKSPVEEAYKDWWGQYPELETDSEYDDMRWAGFQAGFQAAYEEKVREDDYYNELTAQKNTEPYCPDEPEYYDEVEWDEKDDPNLQKIIDKMVEERKSQKLWNILKDKWGFPEDACGDIVEAVAEWLPKEQSAAGSQNVDTELLVDGFNDCLTKIKSNLR